MPLRGLDSDNGSEFINQTLYGYCIRESITFTRSRAWKKNDSAHVEQKNGAVVRHLVGYDRFATRRAYAQLARVYALARLHVNFSNDRPAECHDRDVVAFAGEVRLAERDGVGLVRTSSSSSYIALCSKKITGSSSRID